MASASLATAVLGLLVGMGAIEFVYCPGQLGPLCVAQVDAAFHVVILVAAIGVLNAAVAFIYARIYNGGAAAGSSRTPEVVSFLLCASIADAVLHLFLPSPEPGSMDGARQHLHLGVAGALVVAFLPASATVTYFLSVVLIYAHLRSGGAAEDAGAADTPIATSMKLLTKVTMVAALVTIVLSLTAAGLAFFTG